MRNAFVWNDGWCRQVCVGLAYRSYKRIAGRWVLAGERHGMMAGPKGRLP